MLIVVFRKKTANCHFNLKKNNCIFYSFILKSYEWLFVPWLIYQFLYSLLLIFGPIIVIYIGFEIVEKKLVLLALVPLGIGILSIYIWIHVKIYFDQLSKAGKRVQVAPIQNPVQGVGKPSPINVTVMAPYPPFDKNYSIFDGGANGPAVYQNSNSNYVTQKPPPTPSVQPPTPMPPKQLDDVY